MEAKFILPVTTMLVGVAAWLTFVIARAVTRGKAPWTPRTDVVASILAGGLIVFSSASCLTAGGPAYGQIVRLVVLLAMTAFTLWKIGKAAAAALTAEAVIVGVLAIIAFL